MHDPPDHAIALQLSELLREHLLGNGRYRSLEIREPEHVAAEEMKQNYQFPAASEAADGLHQASLIYLGLVLFFITFVVLACSKLLLAQLKKGEGARA